MYIILNFLMFANIVFLYSGACQPELYTCLSEVRLLCIFFVSQHNDIVAVAGGHEFNRSLDHKTK